MCSVWACVPVCGSTGDPVSGVKRICLGVCIYAFHDTSIHMSLAPQASNTKGRMVVSQGGEPVMVPNVEAILEDFAILGEGLVQAVEARSERWTV